MRATTALPFVTGLPVVACIVLAGCSLAQPTGPSPARQVSARGSATFSAPDDHVGLMFVVLGQGASASSCLGSNSAHVDSVLKALARVGVDAKEIVTSPPSVAPGMGGRDAQPGLVATTNISVTLEKSDLVSGAIKAALGAGAEQFVQARPFKMSSPARRQEALQRAYADARAKAEILASLAGATLGEVISMADETRPGSAPIGGMSPGFRGMRAVVAGVEDGTEEVPVTVFVVYALN